MAQAARLNLRMQRELKLLLSDPPPGASFPFLSADSDFSSLSIIHAQIEGPEGTVYAKGVFDVKIQIPERYPFQPPNVTLATPIYHPNIDNGGRICLDILNLPPKGAWQPSLNISTVLTSIGLLLSEPNPDDGLMCEVSREYKYNRQAFDLKARSMTEKYAKAGAGGDSCSFQGIQSLNSSVTKFGGSQESRLEENEIALAHRKHCGISWKLSLESSSSIQNRGIDVEVNEIEPKGKRKEVNITLDECNLRQEKLHGIRRKLSLQSSCQIQNRNDHDKGNVVENQSSLCAPRAISMNSSASLQHDICSQQNYHLHQTNASLNVSSITSSQQPCHVNQRKSSFNRSPVNVRNNKKMLIESQVSLLEFHSNESHGTSSVTLPVNTVSRTGIDSTDTCKRIFSIGKKLSLGPKGSSKGQANDDKENVALVHEMPISGCKISNAKSGIGRKLSLAPLTQLQENKENHNCQLLPQSENLSTDDVSLPLSHYNRRKENQSHLDHYAKVTGKNEQQKTEGSPIPEALIVLDSEDSEEESDGVLRPKLFRAGKRRGNWIA